MNDRMHLPSGQGGGPSGPSPELSGEELERLLSLLREAYPSPKRDIRAAVAEAIRREGGAEGGGARILKPRKASRAAVLGRIAKWGSLAACIVLVSAVGLRVLPMLVNQAKTADASMPEAFQTAAADTAKDTAEWAEEDIVEEYAVEKAEPEAPAAPESLLRAVPAEEAPAPEPDGQSYADSSVMAYGEEDAPEAEECEPESVFTMDLTGSAVGDEGGSEGFVWSEDDAFLNGSLYATGLFDTADREMKYQDAALMGSPAESAVLSHDTDTRSSALPYYYVRTECEHSGAYRNSYHDIPGVLISRVGVSLFNAWAQKAQAEDPCGVNVLSFAVRFGLSAEDMAEVGDIWYYYDLPEDIPLTEENADAVAAYYAAGGDRQKMTGRAALYALKTAMVREAGLDAYLAWRDPAGDKAFRGWTVQEGAAALGISDARMAELARDAAKAAAAENPGYTVPSVEELLAG